MGPEGEPLLAVVSFQCSVVSFQSLALAARPTLLGSIIQRSPVFALVFSPPRSLLHAPCCVRPGALRSLSCLWWWR
jgi:hypothetical protein